VNDAVKHVLADFIYVLQHLFTLIVKKVEEGFFFHIFFKVLNNR